MTEALRTREWTPAELAALDRTPLIRLAGARPDGTLRPFVMIGHVRVGADEIIRSLNGTGGSWYQGVSRTGQGVIDVDGLQVRVAFVADSGREDEVDDALRARYGNDSGVRRMTSALAQAATLRMIPLA
ncbi:DUF2255 family protein [Actinoplanes sp. Pm04-4]|uniref:DUF2255 family protein n=1 Tax=Paractinoplanes pyxinae TaxID=2997416 RepID=A0ABT4AQ62_9ACTN|nr:DUF2255 family protein [Actinoplanes pyxinae]MCY1136387.1 DUF2255 family protein [Actinoplanes pyxinae]